MMKLLTATSKLLVITLVLFTQSDRVAASEKLTQIAENVYAYVDTKDSTPKNSFGANAGVIIGKDFIVVIDSMVSAKEAKRFIQDIRTISDKPIGYVVNTHYHLDHVFGNAEFSKLGAVVIAQENAKKAMEHSAEETLKNIGEYGLTPEDMQGTTAGYPGLTYTTRMTLNIGDQRIELIHARHAHTSGDTLVYLPNKKVLFTGDILFTDYHPFLAEGNIEEWANELDDIKAMDVEKIIPGHGPLSGKSDLEDMKEYLIQFDQKAKELASRSDDVEKIATTIQSALPARSEGAGLIQMNIQMKYVQKK